MFLGVTHVVLVASRVEAGIGESGPYYIPMLWWPYCPIGIGWAQGRWICVFIATYGSEITNGSKQDGACPDLPHSLAGLEDLESDHP